LGDYIDYVHPCCKGGDDDNKPLPATAVDVRPERPRKGVAYRSRGSFGPVNPYEEEVVRLEGC